LNRSREPEKRLSFLSNQTLWETENRRKSGVSSILRSKISPQVNSLEPRKWKEEGSRKIEDFASPEVRRFEHFAEQNLAAGSIHLTRGSEIRRVPTKSKILWES